MLTIAIMIPFMSSIETSHRKQHNNLRQKSNVLTNPTRIDLTNPTSIELTNTTSIDLTNATSVELTNATSVELTNPTSIDLTNVTSVELTNPTSIEPDKHNNLRQEPIVDFTNVTSIEPDKHNNLRQEPIVDFTNATSVELDKHNNLRQEPIVEFTNVTSVEPDKHNNLRKEPIVDFTNVTSVELDKHNNLRQEPIIEPFMVSTNSTNENHIDSNNMEILDCHIGDKKCEQYNVGGKDDVEICSCPHDLQEMIRCYYNNGNGRTNNSCVEKYMNCNWKAIMFQVEKAGNFTNVTVVINTTGDWKLVTY